MTDEELIETLWNGEVTLSVVASAADRIEQLVKERNDAEQREITKIEVNHQRVLSYLTRMETTEAKLAKAVEALHFYADIDNHKAKCITNIDVKNWKFPAVYMDEGAIARKVLDQLEKTE